MSADNNVMQDWIGLSGKFIVFAGLYTARC